MSTFISSLCASFQKYDEVRDAGLTTPDDVVRFDDILYGQNQKWQVLDVYRPRDQKGPLPVIVSVHGGGWVYGDKELYQYYCMDLSRRGFAVVNFTYRLAPDFQFPAPLEDVNLVFTWVLENAEKYGFDPANIFAVGDSAGAHLLGLYLAMCTNPDYAACYSFAPLEGFVPAAAALNCGVYKFEPEEGVNDKNTLRLIEEFLPEKGTTEEMDLISVTKHVTPDYPPIFLMTTTGDKISLSQTGMLEEVLCANCAPYELHCYGDEEHKPGHVFHLAIRTDDAKTCNDEECAYFRSFCG